MADATCTFELDSANRGDKARPVIRVVMSDGRVTEFKNKAIALPEEPHQVFALLINEKGEPFVTPDGNLAIVNVPIVQLGAQVVSAEQALTWKEVAARTGVSVSSVQRAVIAGDLKKPSKVPGLDRAVRFTVGDVQSWMAKGKAPNTAL